jgi:hypothetical protein
MPVEDNIHQRLNRLVTEISAQRSAASNGDEHAVAWVAGLDHWLAQREAGNVASDLVITHDILPLLLADYTKVLEFKRGYGCAVEMNGAGFESEDRA